MSRPIRPLVILPYDSPEYLGGTLPSDALLDGRIVSYQTDLEKSADRQEWQPGALPGSEHHGTWTRGGTGEDAFRLATMIQNHRLSQTNADLDAAQLLWGFLSGLPVLHDRIGDTCHSQTQVIAGGLFTRRYMRRNAVIHRPVVANIFESQHDLLSRLSGSPQHEELQVFVAQPRLVSSRHAALCAISQAPADIALWARAFRCTELMQEPVFINAEGAVLH